MLLCGQYILADRFLRNSGYLVECEVFSTFGCQFPSKRSFEKFKNTNGGIGMLFCHKNQASAVHLMGSIYMG